MNGSSLPASGPPEPPPYPPNIVRGTGPPAHVTSLLRYASLAFVGACLIWVSAAVPRNSVAYDWSNRLGILILLGITGANAAHDLWAVVTRRRVGWSKTDRWVPLLVSMVVPAVLLLKGWDRLLDALWVR
jgi:hypothetical protein